MATNLESERVGRYLGVVTRPATNTASRRLLDLRVELSDQLQPRYEEAAAFSFRCRAQGIRASSVDFLICTVAVRRSMSILTTDREFEALQHLLPIKLHEIR
jgi:predicted nucleic acid-binding protein